jgi:hypothetical protein
MSGLEIDLHGAWDWLLAEHERGCPRSHPVKDMNEESIARFQQLASRIVYRDWKVQVHSNNGQPRIQICTIVPDALNGQPIQNNGRPVPLCPEMSDAFFIDLAFELIKEFELHETAENFKVDGVRLYYPHAPSGQPLRCVNGARASASLQKALERQRFKLTTVKG